MASDTNTWELGPDLTVHAPSGSSAADAIETVFSAMSGRASPDHGEHIRVEARSSEAGAWQILASEVPIMSVSVPDGLVPVLESLLCTCAEQSCRTCAVVHAAAIEIGGQCILLPGEQASGKSTLSLWMAEQGAGYLGDDLILFRFNDLAIEPFPKAATLKTGAFKLFPETPTYEDPIRGPVRYRVPATARRESVSLEHLRAIVFPQYGPAKKCKVTDVDPELAALALVQQTFGGLERDERVIDLVGKLAAVPARLLEYADLESAGTALRELVE